MKAERAGKPRNIAGAIVRGSDLWGREREIASLWTLLNRGSVLVTAPRRHGKSSLMSAVCEHPPELWSVVELDVEYVETPAEFLTELTATLLQLEPFRKLLHRAKGLPGQFLGWVTSGLGKIDLGTPAIGELKLTLREGLTHQEKWPELTEQLFGALAGIGGPLLVAVDEFPMMISNFLTRDATTAIHFLKWFRAQRQRPDLRQVHFLFGGSVNIEPRLESLGCQALLNDLERFRLDQMTSTESEAFVRDVLLGEGVDFESSVPAEIVRIAACGTHFFLQVLISECLSEARRACRTLEPQDVSPVYHSRVLGPANRARFSHYQTRLREHYGERESTARAILDELAKKGERTDLELKQAIQQRLEDGRDVERALVLLESDYYIVRNGGRVEISSGFLRDWWLRNVPTVGGSAL